MWVKRRRWGSEVIAGQANLFFPLGSRPRFTFGSIPRNGSAGRYIAFVCSKNPDFVRTATVREPFHGCGSRDASLRALETRHADDACA